MSALKKRKKAKFVSLTLFIFGMITIALMHYIWPGIMLVLGIPLATYQYMQRRHYDSLITLFVFVGAWLTVQFDIEWEVLLPVLFSIGAIYLFFREWIESRRDKKDDGIDEEEK